MTRPLALVTGAARGIGRGIADRLAEDGFEVIVLDRAGSDEAVAEIRHAGGAARALAVDLTDVDAVERAMSAEPPLDALVNNAGIFDERALFDIVPEDFRRMTEINVIALFNIAKAAARRMRAGSKIVNIASRSWLGGRNHAHYIASKAAVVGLTRAMAIELAPNGILVNAVAPGLIETPLLQALTPERKAAQLALQPTGKSGTPADIANAVSFLVARRTDFITGQTIIVDGGRSLGGMAGV